jgi:CRP-like cAMP-binding protein
VPFNNHILKQLSAGDRETLLADAEYTVLPVGHTFARVGDLASRAYFPDRGVIVMVREMTTGHHAAVAAIGAEGVVGLRTLYGTPQHAHSLVVLVESSGFHLVTGRFRRMFQHSEALRRITLAHIGARISELTTAVACNRVHSHRQRLARWLLITTDKAKQRSLPVTHEALAQMVGGPRHAVTVALSELRRRGAIAHLRGQVEILDRSILIAQSCECYAGHSDSLRL